MEHAGVASIQNKHIATEVTQGTCEGHCPQTMATIPLAQMLAPREHERVEMRRRSAAEAFEVALVAPRAAPHQKLPGIGAPQCASVPRGGPCPPSKATTRNVYRRSVEKPEAPLKAHGCVGDAGHTSPRSPEVVAATQHADKPSIQVEDKGALGTCGGPCAPPTPSKNVFRVQRLQRLVEPLKAHGDVSGALRTLPSSPEALEPSQHAGKASIQVEGIATKGSSGTCRGPCAPPTPTKNVFRVQLLQKPVELLKAHGSIGRPVRTSPSSPEALAASQHAGTASIQGEGIAMTGASGSCRGPGPLPTATTRNLCQFQRLQKPAVPEKPRAIHEHGQMGTPRSCRVRAMSEDTQATLTESLLHPKLPCAPRPSSSFDRPMHLIQNADGGIQVLSSTLE